MKRGVRVERLEEGAAIDPRAVDEGGPFEPREQAQHRLEPSRGGQDLDAELEHVRVTSRDSALDEPSVDALGLVVRE